MTLLWLILGLSTITVNTGSDQPFMSRDQTNEWKGWLQCAILVYHYTGASKVAWIYGLIRITVASYLFMTGYGHTVYFYKKDDFSFKRVAGVLVRLNLLSCALPYIMKTEYIFYYFAPLVSFWFLIVYATMGIGSGGNKNIMFLLSKIAVSAILVTVIVKIPGVLEFLFKIPHYLARTEWNAAEFRFRVFLDMWIVYVGMGAAIAVIKLNDTNYAASIHKMWKPTLIASAVALPLFFLFQITRETKFAYNAYHPYISWIPILAFIALRNASPSLRNRHSEVFGWIGTCSLETFTLQYHIWMAADTHGLLDLSLFGGIWLVNFVISTVVFLFTSHCVARATGDLTGWILGAAPAKKAVVKKAVLPIFQRMEEVRLKELREASGVLEPAFETVKPVEAVAGTDSVVGLKARCGIIMAVMWVLNLVSL